MVDDRKWLGAWIMAVGVILFLVALTLQTGWGVTAITTGVLLVLAGGVIAQRESKS